jgi:signal transduction histidine kinase
LVFDANQTAIMTNPAVQHMARRDVQSMTLADFLTTIKGKAAEIIPAWMKGQKPEDINNVKFEWYDRTLSATIAPVMLPTTNEQQVDAGNVMVLRDFTKEAELEKAKNMFLGMVSHELRTPMTAIQGYVDVLLATERGHISLVGNEYLHTINASIKQLIKLANELIDVSRIDTGEIALYPQWVDLNTLVNNVVRMVKQEFEKRDLDLTIKLADNLPRLYIDQNRLNQVLLNLLSNAYKYTPQGGATIEISQSNGWVTINISDTGVGIKEADQAKLFERFFRASDRVVQKVGGTGLGLNISKGLVELHGGQLIFHSQYGVGTTFTITLPITGQAATLS